MGEKYAKMILRQGNKIMDAVCPSSVCGQKSAGRLLDVVYNFERNPSVMGPETLRMKVLDARDAR